MKCEGGVNKMWCVNKRMMQIIMMRRIVSFSFTFSFFLFVWWYWNWNSV